MHVDYSLYLVTDSTTAVLGNKDLVTVVRAALEGGVTIVQYRDKKSETADLIRIGRQLHNLTEEYGIPLLINDRVDVALAVGAEGVHVGQEDMDLATTRRILGSDAIIGVTCSTITEAKAAATGGASYLGIGTMFATPTKENTKIILGTSGTEPILNSLAQSHSDLPTVAIGGINASNVRRVLDRSAAPSKPLSGVAIVSAIIAAPDPKKAASELKSLILAFPPTHLGSVEDLIAAVLGVIKQLVDIKPLCHNMTNQVVQNFAANVALAIGGSPIMSLSGAEAPSLAALNGSLVINMGTATPALLTEYALALRAYNAAGNPVLLDPVGAGATPLRKEALNTLMHAGYFSVIKGNENEIATVWGEVAVPQKGVDSTASTSTPQEKASLVQKVARREGNVVLMTGPTDYLSDGKRTLAVSHGHPYLGQITGSGCTLGTTIAAVCAVQRDDYLLATLVGLLVFEIAAERAAAREDVKGPGSFVPAFIDELNTLTQEAARGHGIGVDVAKVESVEL